MCRSSSSELIGAVVGRRGVGRDSFQRRRRVAHRRTPSHASETTGRDARRFDVLSTNHLGRYSHLYASGRYLPLGAGMSATPADEIHRHLWFVDGWRSRRKPVRDGHVHERFRLPRQVTSDDVIFQSYRTTHIRSCHVAVLGIFSKSCRRYSRQQTSRRRLGRV